MNSQRLMRTLPSEIIENILWRFPIEEIVRSSIRSKEWRYNWTKIPKVAFTDDFLKNKANKSFRQRRSKFFSAIYQFLLLHHEPILDFTLSLRNMESSEHVKIDQILLHLSRKNTVKKLHLNFECDLPSSIFSFHQLTDLSLSECSINHPPTFTGFGSLTSLCLEYVYIYKKALMHILSNNPLKRFTMRTHGDSNFWIINDDEYVTMDELFYSIPVIEHLTLDVCDCEYFGRGVIPREVATSLVHLKFLCLLGMCFLENDWLRFLLLLLRSSPNLEKLELQMLCEHDDYDKDLYSVTMQDCSDIWLNHLIELEIEDNRNTKHELEFVKLILAKSHVLEKVRLNAYYKDEELKLLEAFLPSPPASPMVEIIDCHGGKDHVIFTSL